jgi:6-phosphofructokinase 1
VSGLNDVIRGLVMELAKQYGVAEAIGYRHGFAGMVEGRGYAPMRLTPSSVHDINQHGGTVLGSSRGAQDPDRIIDRLVADGVDILFVIGGDGSMPGAGGLAARLREGSLPIGVIGIPKTIDNDIAFIGQSFGFVTSFSVAAKSINAAMIEAHSAIGGVGVVKLMGRHSGFIACYAALANHEADLVLIPEVPFGLDGPNGFLAALHQRVKDTGNAVVVVAEGAGQDVLERTGSADPSGNAALGDIGTRLRAAITQHFEAQGTALTLK